MSRPSEQLSSAFPLRSSRRSTGAVCASTWAASPPRRSCATPTSPTCSTTRPSSSASRATCRFDFGVAWDRSRKVSETHVKGIHFLMKKNKVTEYEGRGSFVDANTIDVTKADGQVERVTFDNAIISTGSRVRLLPGVQLSQNVVTYEEQIMTRELSELDRHRRRRRDRHGVRLLHDPLRRQGHDHRVPRPRPPERGRRRVEGDRASLQEVRRRHPHLDQGRDRRRLRRQGHRHLHRQGRRPGLDRGRQGAHVDRLRPERRGLRSREHRRQAHRSRRDRDRRLHAHERAAHLRDRRRHREAAARARRRGAGRRRGRDDRQGRDHGPRRLPHDAARDVLLAPGRLVRPHRAAGTRRRATT